MSSTEGSRSLIPTWAPAEYQLAGGDITMQNAAQCKNASAGETRRAKRKWDESQSETHLPLSCSFAFLSHPTEIKIWYFLFWGKKKEPSLFSSKHFAVQLWRLSVELSVGLMNKPTFHEILFRRHFKPKTMITVLQCRIKVLFTAGPFYFVQKQLIRAKAIFRFPFGWFRVHTALKVAASCTLRQHREHLLAPVTRQNIIKALCLGCWVGCVVTANKQLQACNGIEPRPKLLGYLGSVGQCDL